MSEDNKFTYFDNNIKRDENVGICENNILKNKFTPDVMVVDPPRKGCDKACLDTMIKMHPSRIVYVSCDVATLARDVKYLGESGYRLDRVCVVDQFGHTGHVETVVLMSKIAPSK